MEHFRGQLGYGVHPFCPHCIDQVSITQPCLMAGLEVLGIVIWLPVQEENEGGL